MAHDSWTHTRARLGGLIPHRAPDDPEIVALRLKLEELRPPIVHGKRSAYNRGCRCEECSAAEATYHGEQKRRRERELAEAVARAEAAEAALRAFLDEQVTG